VRSGILSVVVVTAALAGLIIYRVLAAAAAGEITLHSTDEVYRCSIVGS